jgi:phage shock protein E
MRRHMIRTAVMGGFLAVTLLAGGVSPVGAAAAMPKELEGRWYQSDAGYLMERGILSAGADGKYSPGDLIAREEFLGYIVAGWGEEQGDSVAIASAHGILDEMEKSGTLTRNEAAKITARSLDKLFHEPEEGDDYLAAIQLEDYDACHVCRSFVSQCYVRGLMIGREPGLFAGEELLTRGEAWTIVARMLDTARRPVPETEGTGPVLLTADAAKRILSAAPSTVVLDVRGESERVSGYIPGSICIPLAQLKETGAAALSEHKSDAIIVYCQSGGRSAQALEFLTGLGYERVYDLGGIANWTYDLAY